MSGISGSFGELAGLREKLQRMPEAYVDLKGRLLHESLRLVSDEFNDQRGPDGIAWKQSRRAADEGGLTLSDTGRLRNSFSGGGDGFANVTSSGFEFGSNVKYAAIHQYGGVIRAKNVPYLRFRVGRVRTAGGRGKPGGFVSARSVTIPARPILPMGQLPLPWSDAYAQSAADALREHFGA